MNEDILVSVFVVAYNEEKYIRQALNSIVGQKTNFKFEIIVHDDASTDGTTEIIREFEKKNPDKFKVIYQESNKYQKGIQFVIGYMYPAAKGKYIAYCDGDDYWTDSSKLQKQVDFLENNPEYVMCQHAFLFLYENTGKTAENHTYIGDCDMEIEEFIDWNGERVPQIGTWLFRRELAASRPELFHKIGIDGVMSISDQPLAIYLSLQGKVRYMDEIMSVWRRHSKTVFTRYGDQQNFLFHTNMVIFLEQLKQYCDDKYFCSIDKAIKRETFLENISLGNYSDVIESPFFQELPFSSRCRMRFGKLCPQLVRKLRMLKNKNAGK